MGYLPRQSQDLTDPEKEFDIIRTKVKEFRTALFRGRNEEALELFLFLAYDSNVFLYEEDPTEMEVVDDEKMDWFWWEVRWQKVALYHTSPKGATGFNDELSPEYCLRVKDISHTATVALIYAICNNYYDFVKMAARKVELNNLMFLYSEYLLYAEGQMKDLLIRLGAKSLEEYKLIIADCQIFYLADPALEEMVELILEINEEEADFCGNAADDLRKELGSEVWLESPGSPYAMPYIVVKA